MYDDVELYNKFRFRHHGILIIVNELQGDLEYPDTRQSSLLATLQVIVALWMYATGCFQNINFFKLYFNLFSSSFIWVWLLLNEELDFIRFSSVKNVTRSFEN